MEQNRSEGKRNNPMSNSTKEIQRRRKSAKNIQQITSAMETVSATKMRRAQDRAVSSRAYAEKAFLMLQSLAKTLNVNEHALLMKKQTNVQIVALITPDKGLVGALNTNMFRKVDEFLKEQDKKGKTTHFITAGKKATNYIKKTGRELLAEFPSFDGNFTLESSREFTNKLITSYTEGGYDKVIMAFTNFYSTLSQKPFIRGILPLTHEKIEDLGDLRDDVKEKLKTLPTAPDYIFEPGRQEVLDKLLPRLVATLVYHNLLEANASEHSARMIAMKNASDNASELIDELTLTFNRLRQEGITKELAEISAGSATNE